MFLPLRAATAALVLGLMALPAQAYLARNNLVVEKDGPQTFNVPYRGKSGDAEFWCAAGDYVEHYLGLPPNTRIWRLSPPPRGRKDGIRFSLSPEGATSQTGLSVFGSGPAGSVTASVALSACPPRVGRFDN